MKPNHNSQENTSANVDPAIIAPAEKLGCSVCGKSRAPLVCGCCHQMICKSCTDFLEADEFYLLDKNPLNTDDKAFCQVCYQEKVLPEMQKYQDLVALAKNIQVFMKNQSKETRLIPRLEKTLRVENCKEPEEVMMRLAIMAVQKKLNALIDMDIVGKKVKDGSYSTTIFSGSAVPAEFNDRRVVKDRSIWQNPN